MAKLKLMLSEFHPSGFTQGPNSLVEEPLEGAGPWLCPVEPDPTPGPMLSYLVPEEDEGLRALALLRLPPKKRSTLGSSECPHPGLTLEQAGTTPLSSAQRHTWVLLAS